MIYVSKNAKLYVMMGAVNNTQLRGAIGSDRMDRYKEFVPK